MSSYGANNILRHDIVTLDVFFNNSESVVNYLAKKKPEFSYKNVPAYGVAPKRFNDQEQDPLEIEDCMKHHMIIYEKGKKVALNEYLCDCHQYGKFDFVNCQEEEEKEGGSEVTVTEEYLADEDSEVNKELQIFDFVEVHHSSL